MLCGVALGAPSLHPAVISESRDEPALRTADFSRQGRSVVREDLAYIEIAVIRCVLKTLLAPALLTESFDYSRIMRVLEVRWL